MNMIFVKNENKDDFWSQILKKKLQKKGVQAAGGIYGFDGHKYTAINYFHISEPTAKAIADLFIKFEILEKKEEKLEKEKGNKYEPKSTLRNIHILKNSGQPENENDDQSENETDDQSENETDDQSENETNDQLQNENNNQPKNENDDFRLKIENDDFLIISLNSKLLYATNDKHCIFAYRCTFSFVIMLFSNYQNVAPKSPLYKKISAEISDNSDGQTGQLSQQNKPINPEIYARITFEIASEIILQGG